MGVVLAKAVNPFVLNCLTRKHANTQTRKHANTQTRKHANTQTRKHASTQTRKHANTQTRKHANTQTRKHANTQTRKHANRFPPPGTPSDAHLVYSIPMGKPLRFQCSLQPAGLRSGRCAMSHTRRLSPHSSSLLRGFSHAMNSQNGSSRPPTCCTCRIAAHNVS